MTERVIVVGAGLSGLVAARELATGAPAGTRTDQPVSVTVFDKGRSPGGRLATRRIAGATLDHGAQFFTVRGAALAEQVERWRAAGLVDVWCHGFDVDPATGDGHPRYVTVGGMNRLAKHLAVGLDVRCGHLVFGVRRGSSTAWEVVIDDGTVHPADAVIVTCPLPQTFSLLFEAGVELPTELFGDDYDRTMLTVLDGPSAVPPPGGVQAERLAGTPWSFVGDNRAKGISAVPAVTFHASPSWSEAHWDDDPEAVHEALRGAARPWFGAASLVESQVKRWRFATPRSPWPDACWHDPTGTLVLAGDAFRGPKIEGAYESGRAAADRVGIALADRTS